MGLSHPAIIIPFKSIVEGYETIGKKSIAMHTHNLHALSLAIASRSPNNGNDKFRQDDNINQSIYGTKHLYGQHANRVVMRKAHNLNNLFFSPENKRKKASSHEIVVY